MSSPLAASRCTCCHICHTSLKTSRREFFPCSTCPTIICRQCVELAEQDWNQVISSDEWSCPRCCGDCPCKRCRNKVSAANSTPKNVTDKKKTHTGKRKRDRSTYTVFEDNAYLASPKIRRTMSSADHCAKAISSPSSTFTTPIPPLTADDKKARILELYTKNQQCLDYIARTERLLALIRKEQDNIQGELKTILSRSADDKKESLPESVSSSSLSQTLPVAETSEAYSSSDEDESQVEDYDLHSSSADEYDGDSDDNDQESNNEREVTINLDQTSALTRPKDSDGKKETAAKELAFLRSGTPLFV